MRNKPRVLIYEPSHHDLACALRAGDVIDAQSVATKDALAAALRSKEPTHYRAVVAADFASIDQVLVEANYAGARINLGAAERQAVEAILRALAPLAEEAAAALGPGPVQPALDELVGEGLSAVKEVIAKAAASEATVVIQGETGTGKELVARAIHKCSDRRKGPMVVLNCAKMPPDLIESELFGHEKGAFTGAVALRLGTFERANGGTIFLDELGELPLDLQPKLLRVLENGEVCRVGGSEVIEVDVRVVAATNRDLEKEIRAGRFREDLFYRLSVINILLPPLRERRDDIPGLAEALLNRQALKDQRPPRSLTGPAIAKLKAYTWPGNVRELGNVLERAQVMTERLQLDAEDLELRDGPTPATPAAAPPLVEHLLTLDAAGATATMQFLLAAKVDLTAHERLLLTWLVEARAASLEGIQEAGSLLASMAKDPSVTPASLLAQIREEAKRPADRLGKTFLDDAGVFAFVKAGRAEVIPSDNGKRRQALRGASLTTMGSLAIRGKGRLKECMPNFEELGDDPVHDLLSWYFPKASEETKGSWKRLHFGDEAASPFGRWLLALALIAKAVPDQLHRLFTDLEELHLSAPPRKELAS